MTDILEKICADKSRHVEKQKEAAPIAVLEARIKEKDDPRGFRNKILEQNKSADTHSALIAEIKKASPSHGLIREDFDPAKLAIIYENAGASCLSILTDEPYFMGQDRFIMDGKTSSTLPVLRKDFMIDRYQIFESRAIGADCILLIMAMLDDEKAQDLYDMAMELDLDVLVETHNDEEIERAIALGANMIGVNNRNLKTLEIKLETALELVNSIPEDVVTVGESGIQTNEDVKKLYESGYNAILVGESLMRQDDLNAAVRSLLNKT